jgi:hypothetical protein
MQTTTRLPHRPLLKLERSRIIREALAEALDYERRADQHRIDARTANAYGMTKRAEHEAALADQFDLLADCAYEVAAEAEAAR